MYCHGIFNVCVFCVLLCLIDSIVTPIMGSPVAGLHGQVLESDSDEFSPVMRKEKARIRHMERKKRKGKIEVSFNMGKLVSSAVSKFLECRKCWHCLFFYYSVKKTPKKHTHCFTFRLFWLLSQIFTQENKNENMLTSPQAIIESIASLSIVQLTCTSVTVLEISTLAVKQFLVLCKIVGFICGCFHCRFDEVLVLIGEIVMQVQF